MEEPPIAKSVPVEDVASVMFGPACDWFAGPMLVMPLPEEQPVQVPLMVMLLKVWVAPKVLLSESKVEEAALTVILAPLVRAVPLMVPNAPTMRFAPIEVEAITEPF